MAYEHELNYQLTCFTADNGEETQKTIPCSKFHSYQLEIANCQLDDLNLGSGVSPMLSNNNEYLKFDEIAIF